MLSATGLTFRDDLHKQGSEITSHFIHVYFLASSMLKWSTVLLAARHGPHNLSLYEHRPGEEHQFEQRCWVASSRLAVVRCDRDTRLCTSAGRRTALQSAGTALSLPASVSPVDPSSDSQSCSLSYPVDAIPWNTFHSEPAIGLLGSPLSELIESMLIVWTLLCVLQSRDWAKMIKRLWLNSALSNLNCTPNCFICHETGPFHHLIALMFICAPTRQKKNISKICLRVFPWREGEWNGRS